MYNLVARIPDGLGQLRTLLENHITSQGLNALEKCGDQAFNVSKHVLFLRMDCNKTAILMVDKVVKCVKELFSA